MNAWHEWLSVLAVCIALALLFSINTTLERIRALLEDIRRTAWPK